ncbi:hypothetical protein ACTG9Q_06850 [Actinokineospora sp. 24-640]
MNLFGDPVAAKALKGLDALGKVVTDSPPPAATPELVKIQVWGAG